MIVQLLWGTQSPLSHMYYSSVDATLSSVRADSKGQYCPLSTHSGANVNILAPKLTLLKIPPQHYRCVGINYRVLWIRTSA